MTAEKVVTHADLSELYLAQESVRVDTNLSSATADKVHALLNRLIAAAEADAPPLPEGWVLHQDGGHSHPYYHERGWLYRGCDVDGGCVVIARVGEDRFTLGRLTPLRPTVTEADVERAVAMAIQMEEAVLFSYRWREVMRAAFEAAGIEVTP